MKSYLETPAEFRARCAHRLSQRRVEWLEQTQDHRTTTILVARRMARLGYGWEDISVVCELNRALAISLVFGRQWVGRQRG